jgi:hypothetical protein
MTDDTKLPREIQWDGAHVSELALTAIADGQDDIVDRDAVAHADACEWCAGRMGRAALLSAAVGHAVEQVKPSLASVRPRGASPARAWRALAMGVAVALLAALPSLPHFATTVVELLAYGRALSVHGVPVLVRGGLSLVKSETASTALSAATMVSAVLLVMMGWAIARTRSQVSSERSAS